MIAVVSSLKFGKYRLKIILCDVKNKIDMKINKMLTKYVNLTSPSTPRSFRYMDIIFTTIKQIGWMN